MFYERIAHFLARLESSLLDKRLFYYFEYPGLFKIRRNPNVKFRLKWPVSLVNIVMKCVAILMVVLISLFRC